LSALPHTVERHVGRHRSPGRARLWRVPRDPARGPGSCGTTAERDRTAAVVALIPAHDEEAGIAACVESLHAQTRRPDRIIVVADKCTDRTAQVALQRGAEVWTTVANDRKKAGALNQALDRLLPTLGRDDLVLAMDADSWLAPRFIEVAERNLTHGVGAVGGNFYGAVNHGLLRRMQCNEYTRFARETSRKQAKAWVLTGTGTLFRSQALREVARARRGGRLPGAPHVYDVEVLTEDNELTLALKHLGYSCVSPRECVVMTDVMPTWRALWRQRLRWKRGAMENLGQYGVTRVTLPYLVQHLMMLLGLAFLALYGTVMATTVLVLGGLTFSPLWLVPAAVFMLERAVTVRANGWKNMLLAASLVPEWVYELFMQGCLIKAGGDALRGTARRW
jgi:cellulose synthase/poly-beta-1,6-N-acetylglucosamine synthase-like glycosyltransferase